MREEPDDPECGKCGHPWTYHYDEKDKIDEYACDYCDNKRVQCDCEKYEDFAFEPDPIMPWD